MRIVSAALAALLLSGSLALAQSPVSIFSGRVNPLGYCQITNLAAATALVTASCSTGSVPAGASSAAVIVEAQAVRYTDDGVTTPTAAIGMPLAVGTLMVFTETNLGTLRFIASTPGSILNVSFY